MTPPVPIPESLSIALMAGAIVGVLARAYLMNGQNPLSRETGQDVFLGIGLAVAWLYPLPGLGVLYPPFQWPSEWPTWVPGVMFAMFTYLFIEMGKRALLKWAPEIFAKYVGKAVPNGTEPQDKKGA